MRNTRKLLITALTAALSLPTTAWAAPKVGMVVSAEKEVAVEENGKKVIKLVPAEIAVPGETILYSITFQNTGDEVATKVAIVDPIPEGTTYIPGSASNQNDVYFSIDRGETYKKPSLLTYEITNPDGSKEKRIASPEQYTHIRWEIAAIAPGEKGRVEFRVKVQ